MDVIKVISLSTPETEGKIDKPVGPILNLSKNVTEKSLVDNSENICKQLEDIEQLEIGISDVWDYNKKLLIIDTDNKFLYDTSDNSSRYYLHQFLIRVSEYYNIVIWSSESMEALKKEMKKLGISSHLHYKIAAYLDRKYFINISSSEDTNLTKHPIIIWRGHPKFSSKNTIIISDTDPPIRSGKDDELLKFCEYLLLITDVEDFRTLDHSKWKEHRKIHQMPQITDYVLSVKSVIQEYKVKELNPVENSKKLLILDIDRTIFTLLNRKPFKRPYLNQFLKKAYKHYNIAIWSAREMYGIDVVIDWMGMSRHPDYNIAFQLDGAAMVRTNFSNLQVRVKPLHIIWGKYRQYSAKNTIMLDDQKVNFRMNPQSGLTVKPFLSHNQDPHQDVELLKLADYLEMIACVEDFKSLNHNRWEEYMQSKSVLVQYNS